MTPGPLQPHTAPTQVLGEKFYQGETDTPPLASGALVKTCIVCLYSNQNTDNMLRFGNKLIILATGLR